MGVFNYQDKKGIATDLASPVLGVLAIIVGFLASVVTFLLTAQGIKKLEALRTTQGFRVLIDDHWEAVFLGFAASIASLILIAFAKTPHHDRFHILFNAWFTLGAASLFAFARVYWNLRKLLAPDPLPSLPPEIPEDQRPVIRVKGKAPDGSAEA
jgi:drug/metabolite transporter (DMT)-like permease